MVLFLLIIFLSVKCFPKPEMMKIDLDITPNSSSPQTEFIGKLSWETLFLSEKLSNRISDLGCFRTTLATKGLLSEALRLIKHCRKPGSISNFKFSWRKWVN